MQRLPKIDAGIPEITGPFQVVLRLHQLNRLALLLERDIVKLLDRNLKLRPIGNGLKTSQERKPALE